MKNLENVLSMIVLNKLKITILRTTEHETETFEGNMPGKIWATLITLFKEETAYDVERIITIWSLTDDLKLWHGLLE